MINNLPQQLNTILSHFNISGSVGNIFNGPLVSEVEYLLSAGSKFSVVEKLSADIGRELGISGVRVSTIPNSPYIRFEIPQISPQTVPFFNILSSEEFTQSTADLPICLGVNMRGVPVVKDICKMPHLLVAGTTGSGKSVGLNSFILSLIYHKSPQQLQFILIDPKRIEFSLYNKQQYMFRPVITDTTEAIIALNDLRGEMERRYTLFSQCGTRNIKEYLALGRQLPYIICIIDEFADLIMTDKKVEKYVQILAQKSRASGIHLIIATQRPSVDVITGSLKANLPTRLSYKVASSSDSQTILNTSGAEDLIGRGDSLYLEENGCLTRILGAYVSTTDINLALKPYRRIKDNIQSSTNSLETTQNASDTKKSPTSQNIISRLWKSLGRHNQNKILNKIIDIFLKLIVPNISRRR